MRVRLICCAYVTGVGVCVGVAEGGSVVAADTGVMVEVGALTDSGVEGVCVGVAEGGSVVAAGPGAAMEVGSLSTDSGVGGVCVEVAKGGAIVAAGAGAAVAVGVGSATPDGSSEPQAASVTVRVNARTKLSMVRHLVVRVRVISRPRFHTGIIAGFFGCQSGRAKWRAIHAPIHVCKSEVGCPF